ncbi:hypothetical protein FJQ98_02735 [Lysinibacillus agricola]|uniref:Lipoprotein n=1 Tax=Lysinibacillus agricola TaxID=2590012 RepID=A0ABX7AVU9_9BACI|nr:MULTISPECIES: hypothetical protein [Lysinibacillus]QQP13008.1 hypothetical protein FJQ98_02735 [Lysinibacillus agricola]
MEKFISFSLLWVLGGINLRKLALFILCIFLVGCTSKVYTDNFDKGKIELENGNYSEAIKFFEIAEQEKNTKEIDELISIAKILNDSLIAKKEGKFEASNYNAEKIIDYKIKEEVNKKIIESTKKQAREIVKQTDVESAQKEELEANISKGKVLLEQQKFDEAYTIFNALVTQEGDYPSYKLFKDLFVQATNLAKETVDKKEAYIVEQQNKAEEEKKKKAEEEKQRKIAEENAKKEAQKQAQNAKVSKEQAKQLVIQKLQLPNNPNLFVEYEYDNEHGDYVFHVYEVVIDDPKTKEGHTATWGWYGVDPKNKYVYDAFN